MLIIKIGISGAVVLAKRIYFIFLLKMILTFILINENHSIRILCTKFGSKLQVRLKTKNILYIND